MVNRSSSEKSGIKLVNRLLNFVDLDNAQCILDIGCGRGAITRLLAERYAGSQVVGIDIDEEELAIAEENNTHQSVRFIKGDGRKIPVNDRSLDLALASGVLHHIYDWEKVIGEIGRTLKVNGFFILADMVYPDWVTRIDERSGFKFGLYTLDVNKLTRLLQDEGFITVHSAFRKRYLWQEYEAVFLKVWEKAWARF